LRRAAALLVVALVAAGETSATAAARPAPRIEQMVVFRSGEAERSRARARATSVRVGGTGCRVAARTPLAVLARSEPAPLRLRDDFGSCPGSAAGVYVAAIGPDEERGAGGWVYKVGRRAAPAGAGDPTGPFGRGRLRKGQRVLWFYCLQAGNCQRSLAVRATVAGGEVSVRVTGYDDNGRGVRIEGATVTLGALELETDADGLARATVAPGRYAVVARKAGLVRSFRERVAVE
jgi:hypothetical protein